MAPVAASPALGRMVVVSLFAFLVGILIGRLLDGTGPPLAPPAKPDAPVADAAGAAPAVGEFAKSFRESLDLPDPGPGPEGTLTLRGSVATEGGAPLPGVTVRGVPSRDDWDPDRSGGPPAGDPLLPEAREELRRAILARRGTRETVSGADGGFLLTGLTSGEYLVVGYRRGWSLRTVGRRNRRAGDEVKLVGRRVLLAEVDVLLPDGSRAERALLEIRGAGPHVVRNRTWTPAASRIEMDPGPGAIRAFAEAGKRVASQEVELLVEVGRTPDPIVLLLRERTGICGTVTFPPMHDMARPSYRIAALRVREGGPSSPELLQRGQHAEGRCHRYSPRRGEGSFVLPDLPPGRYLIGVVDRSREVLASAVTVVTEGMATIDLTIDGPSTGEATAVRILDPAGRPVAQGDIQLQAEFRGADGLVASGRRPDFLGEGAFRVYRPRARDGSTTEGTCFLQIRSERLGPRVIPYDPDGAPELVIRFEEPATLTLEIPGYPGSRYEGATWLAVLRADEPRRGFPEEKRPGPRGRTVFGPLAPGDYVVRLSVDSDRHARETVLEVPLSAGSGPCEQVLRPPPLRELTVLAAGSAASYRLEPTGGGSWRRGQAAGDGATRFERILAGEYVLWRSEGAESEAMPLRIAGDAVVAFEATPLDAFRVILRDPAGTFGRAGFAGGDLIVAVDGTEIESAAQGSALLRLRAESGPVTLTVLRGGERLALSLDLAALRDPSRAGGSLHPWVR